MLFQEVIGQNEIKHRLIASVHSGRISHAQLFTGVSGWGALPLAMAYAQFILCENRQGQDACGQCRACRKMERLTHPDFHIVVPIVADSRKETQMDEKIVKFKRLFNKNSYLTYDDWRIFLDAGNKTPIIPVGESYELQRKLSLKSTESIYKIALVWLPEKMNVQAANTLLKILEEPYQNTFFLFVSEEPTLLLPTITSRLQRVDLASLPINVIKDQLIERIGLSEQRALQLAQMSQGDWRRALNKYQEARIEPGSKEEEANESLYNFEQFKVLMRMCWERKMEPVNKWVEQMSKIGRERQKLFLSDALNLLRNNFMRNFGKPELIAMSERELQFATRFSPYVHEGNIIPLMEEFENAYADISANGNPKFIFTDLCIKVMQNIRP